MVPPHDVPVAKKLMVRAPALVAALRQHGVESDVVRNADDAAGRAGTDGAPARRPAVDDRDAAPDRRGAVAIEQRGRFHRISFEPRA